LSDNHLCALLYILKYIWDYYYIFSWHCLLNSWYCPFGFLDFECIIQFEPPCVCGVWDVITYVEQQRPPSALFGSRRTLAFRYLGMFSVPRSSIAHERYCGLISILIKIIGSFLRPIDPHDSAKIALQHMFHSLERGQWHTYLNHSLRACQSVTSNKYYIEIVAKTYDKHISVGLGRRRNRFLKHGCDWLMEMLGGWSRKWSYLAKSQWIICKKGLKITLRM